MLLGATLSHALDFGPDGMFSLTGFAEATVGVQGNYCLNCQVVPDTVSKQLRVADAIIPGKHYETVTTTNWQIQPYLGAKYNLGNGFELSGLLSQRWRQGTINGAFVETRYGGTVDVPDFWYEKNIAIRHEDYGSVRIGSMTTRGWSVADFPYGGNLGVSDSWGSSGAGYGMLTNAIRLGSRQLDVAEGDLFLELTYDQGNDHFKRLSPQFYELYAQFHKGDLVVDAVYQDAVNGGAGAWGHAPFTGVTPYAQDDSFVGTNGAQFSGTHQNIAMVMARYQVNAKVEVSGGIRQNKWSGANVAYNPADNWTSGFNVDYSNPLAISPPGYAASSVDFFLGGRYRTGPWTFFTAMVFLGEAETKNPSDRGQHNTATINTLGAKYDYAPGLQLEATAGMVNYGRKGLSPMSMPGNASFSNVDSRISQDGQWVTVGMIYSF
ncbi:hypothetical protein DIC66_05955 [Rhodoferax lacus]|uniref:Porin n=1 Tax=Rhodoferax lacus TaxID=2184758 RepID=A0A3E1RI15_9BURK|nr:hypothetical protein [Rhodoferax lacus]RFO98250.1 hypothetical protein DIC66_05955 [Rhodoferax lacus]